MHLKTIFFTMLVLLLFGAGLFYFYNSRIPVVGGKPPVSSKAIAAMCAHFPANSRYNNQVAFYADLQPLGQEPLFLTWCRKRYGIKAWY